MAQFSFNALGYWFQSSINILWRSYECARTALEDDIERAAETAVAYQQARDEGAEFIGEKDEFGGTIWDQQDVLNHQYEMAQDALRSLRRAYVISLYHHWERGARAWTKSPKGNHEELVPKVEALGMKVEQEVHTLRILANLLKHDSDKWGAKLISAAPSLVGGVTLNVPNVTDWYEAVILSEDWMILLFEAVRASGPTTETLWA
jgi:hypothetical protein